MKQPLRTYKYEKFLPQYYNLASQLIDENVTRGLRDKIAVYYQDRAYTYGEIQRMVNQAANAFHILGVGMDQRVLLVLYDSPEAVASFFGAIKVGAVPVPINYMYTGDDFRYLLNNSRARTLVAHEDFVEELEAWRDRFLFLENTLVVGHKTRSYHIAYHDIVDRCSDQYNAAFTTHDDQAFWNYTSGSTGAPKGVVHLQNDVTTCIENYAKGMLGITHRDILFSASKFFFAYGLGNSFFYPFGTGASVVLLPERPLAETIFETIHKYHPTIFFGVPTLYANMLQLKGAEKRYDLSSLRVCASAGEALPKEIFHEFQRRFHIEILDGIGSSELLHIFISNRPGDVQPGSSGKLVPGYSARIVDENGHDLPDDEVGTLLVRGDSIAAFYWRHASKTKTSMLGEWFNTGDKYRRDKDGYFYYCGRGDDMLKVGGIWVSPIEIEDTLLMHPAVLQAAVVAKKDKNLLVKPKAFVVLKEGYQASPELAKELQMFVKESIAPYKFPRWVEFIKEMPMTATGKIQRHKLRED